MSGSPRDPRLSGYKDDVDNITRAVSIPNDLWETFPPAAQAIIFALDTRVVALEAEVASLKTEIADLKSRLDQNSGNSHKPPSTDLVKRHQKEKTGKPKGGRLGHDAHFRVLAGPERVDHVVAHYPTRCHDCGGKLSRDAATGEPRRHQVTELPVVRAVITEHRLYKSICPCCRATNRAELPAGVPTGAFGPRFTALVALMVGRFRLSRRECSQFIAATTDTTVAPSTVVKLCERASDALEGPVASIAAEVRASSVAYVDETTYRRSGKRTWLWVAVSSAATLFRLAEGRSRKERHALLGETFGGIVVSDRYSVYNDLVNHERGVCHAHLKRDLAALAERGGRIGRLAELVRNEQKRMFALYHARERGEVDQATVLKKLAPLKARLTRLVREGKGSRHRRGRALFRHMWQLWPALFTFVEISGVEGTNSNAERALRPAVIWRKTCFGTASVAGDLFVERMLTVSATCCQRKANLFSFLCDAVTAHFKGISATPIPQAA